MIFIIIYYLVVLGRISIKFNSAWTVKKNIEISKYIMIDI